MSTGDYKWVDKIMKRVNHKLFSLCGNIEEAFALFDVDDDGLIEYDEFLKTFQSLDVGLTDKQAYELMRSIDTDNNGVVDFKEFCERFQIVFDKVRITSDGNPLEAVSTDAHENLSRILSQKDKEANTLESKIEINRIMMLISDNGVHLVSVMMHGYSKNYTILACYYLNTIIVWMKHLQSLM
jgi:hypothetical protein